MKVCPEVDLEKWVRVGGRMCAPERAARTKDKGWGMSLGEVGEGGHSSWYQILEDSEVRLRGLDVITGAYESP